MPTSPQAILRLFFAAGAAVTATMVTDCSGGSVTPATTSLTQSQRSAGATSPAAYTFQTIDNDKDPTFNQLLGINTGGIIAGYYGSGSASSPNKGYTVKSPYAQADFTSENYPGSVQTQVTCINYYSDTGGFWVDSKGVNRGFIRWKGAFTSYTDPNIGKGTVTQILGLNNSGIAVGFYTNGAGVNFGFELNHDTGKFTAITPPGAHNVTASAIDSHGDVTGFYTSGTKTIGFIKIGSSYSTFEYPGAPTTITAGINDHRNIVGAYVGSNGKMHGFLLKQPLKNAMWTPIDDPKGVGSTFINGINNNGDMVGFYGPFPPATHGMLITP